MMGKRVIGDQTCFGDIAILPGAKRIKGFALALLVMVVLSLGPGLAPASAAPQLVVDMHTGEVLYAEDAGIPWHPASLTKLMTAFVTFRAIEAGRVHLDTPVIMTPDTLKVPPSRTGLPPDTALSLRDALYVLVVKSANDVALAIAKTVSGSVDNFVAEMNDTARLLGMSASFYANPNGLDDPRQVNSARDLAVLGLTIFARYPQYRDLFSTDRVRLDGTVLRSHNNLLTDYAGTTGMKTGFICAAGLNVVATARRGDRELMVVIMGASSARERGEMAAKLFDAGFSNQLKGKGQNIVALSNRTGVPPVNMRDDICGSDAKEYVAAQSAAFPFGLKGEPSFLSQNSVAPRVYRAATLGRLRNVPLPQPRPLWAPSVPFVAMAEQSGAVAIKGGASGAPLPRPRP